MKIYVTYTKDNFTKKQLEELEMMGKVIILEDFFELEEAPYLKDEEEKILAVDPDWYNWNIPKEHLEKVPNLKAICLSTTAYDWIDTDYCKQNNIIVTNIPKYSTDSVAEYAIFLMMCLAKKLPLQFKNDFDVEYNHSMLTNEINGKTIGIIGLGNIGSKIAALGTNLGMNVVYWNRNKKECNYKYKELLDIFKDCDYIFPTFATNENTSKLITDEMILSMNNNNFINVITDPIEIYNHELMIKIAEEGKIGYAFENRNNENAKMKDYNGNIMITGSYAWYTKEATDRLIEIWCNNIINILKENPQNIV